jgi:hypothetical protein
MYPYPNLNPIMFFLLFGGLFGGSQPRVAGIFRQAVFSNLIGAVPAALVADSELRQQQKQIIQEVVNADSLHDVNALKNKSKTLGEIYDTLPAGSIVFPTP